MVAKNSVERALDAVIVGAGFSGMYMLHQLRSMGLKAQVFEAGTDVGGTWYWNRYPGARCDVESMSYCYTFDPQLQREWKWTERYPSQPEILRYLQHVAERLDLRRDIVFNKRVTAAQYDSERKLWSVTTATGERVAARFCIMATGCLSTPRAPDFPGQSAFEGRIFHTGQWPHEPIDFTGRIVGMIGTGSTGIQVAPTVAKVAKHLYVFQRTPNFSVPARNRPLTAAEITAREGILAAHNQKARESLFGVPWDINLQSALQVSAEERQKQYESAWDEGGATPTLVAYVDLLASEAANETAAEFVRNKIRAIVRDQNVAELLTPRDHPIGAKRICVDTDYFATYNRPNVTLVDVRSAPIQGFTATGIRTAAGEYAVDDVIFATGFDAMTGALLSIDIRGRDGVTLKSRWQEGPKTYLGLMVAGFPNLITITGPGSPSVLSNVVVSIEQHVEWIAALLRDMRARGRAVIEADAAAQDSWMQHVADVANTTLFPRANSWDVGANIPGKPRVFMPYVGGVGAYRQKCDEVAAKGYEGFQFSG
jgi:cyclohexanone monooxygenase